MFCVEGCWFADWWFLVVLGLVLEWAYGVACKVLGGVCLFGDFCCFWVYACFVAEVCLGCVMWLPLEVWMCCL